MNLKQRLAQQHTWDKKAETEEQRENKKRGSRAEDQTPTRRRPLTSKRVFHTCIACLWQRWHGGTYIQM